MAFLSLILVYLVIIIIVVFVATTTAIVLFIMSAIMKKRHLNKKKFAEQMGNYSYTSKKTYIIPKVFGFICLVPLVFCVGVILYAVIVTEIDHNTSLYYNVMNLNTERIQEIIDSGVSPDCTEESNDPATDGDETLLYLLAQKRLYSQFHMDDESFEYKNEKTLEMMELLIQNGADVNYVVYDDDKNDPRHSYEDEHSIYYSTDQCGWTPLMVATYYGDFEMIKLLVENGADVNAVDYCGFNVINILADKLDDERGYEILNYYLELGVDPNNVTNYTQTSLWLAERRQSGDESFENDKICEKLESLYLEENSDN